MSIRIIAEYPETAEAKKLLLAEARFETTTIGRSVAPMLTRQVQLGHSEMSTTLEFYTVPIPAHLREAVENLSQWVTNGDEFGQIAEGVPTTIQ